MERKLLTDLNLQNNKLVQAGFEVVTELPTTNLFDGREVFFDTQKYFCVNNTWIRIVAGSLHPVSKSGNYNDLTDKPTIPNPTTNAIEITSLYNWFNPNVDKYIIPEDLMRELLTGNIPMAELLNTLNGASCSFTAYNVDCKTWGVDTSNLLTHLISKEHYEVYVENDIDSIIYAGLCSFVFKVDGNKIIIECYRKIVL